MRGLEILNTTRKLLLDHHNIDFNYIIIYSLWLFFYFTRIHNNIPTNPECTNLRQWALLKSTTDNSRKESPNPMAFKIFLNPMEFKTWILDGGAYHQNKAFTTWPKPLEVLWLFLHQTLTSHSLFYLGSIGPLAFLLIRLPMGLLLLQGNFQPLPISIVIVVVVDSKKISSTMPC